MIRMIAGIRKPRRTHSAARRIARSGRPSVEAMEGRALMTALPMMYSNSASVVENGAGPATMSFTVSLTSPSATSVTVGYATTGGTAIDGVDFVSASGTLAFAPGQMKATIPVTVLPDLAATSNRSLSLNLSGAVGATLFTPKLTGTIVEQNSMPAPKLSIANATADAGLGSGATMTFTVSLNEPLAYPVTVTASTADLTAKAGINYVATSQVLTFAPGQTTAQFTVAVLGSSVVATDYFLVNLTAGSVAIGQSQASGTIIY